MTAPRCRQCDTPMEEGFVPDTGHANAGYQSTWVAGLPERSFWYGLKLRDKRRHPVRTFRCPKCGLLESYA